MFELLDLIAAMRSIAIARLEVQVALALILCAATPRRRW
jgi:hypothetical protein